MSYLLHDICHIPGYFYTQTKSQHPDQHPINILRQSENQHIGKSEYKSEKQKSEILYSEQKLYSKICNLKQKF